ncbi:acetyl-CoA carboxylase biotin carboxyl carrier protein subunit [Pedobacter agri]|uniref:acetyl-CoA carboxylase biotin carboxyl carrier protein subunit n=1 Tax=Pedobacter agri TaxID=454586 RepID=UPI00292D5571|nr:acetyl-CoA carboxylase biotin carboxyl carrier protein subunit [Pedobacter agri]
MYKVKVNDQFQFDIEINNNVLKLNGEELALDSVNLSNISSHVLYQDKSYNAEVISFDGAEKTCSIKVNGVIYQVKVEDQFDQLLKQMGMDNLASNKISEIKAPMPGLVLNVLVAENAEVKKGDNLLILEAMKMENILKSSADGIVKKVLIQKGDKVEKNQILIQFK